MVIYRNIWVLMLVVLCNGLLQSQKVIDILQAQKIAIANNQKIRIANLEVLKQKANLNKAYELESTQINGEFGQFNSAYFDTGFGVSQGFSLPQAYKRKKALYGIQVNTAEATVKLSEANLNQRLDELFLEYDYLHAKVNLLKFQDSLYAKYLEKAVLRWKSGESDILEKTAAEQQRINLSNQLDLANKFLKWVEIEFNWLINDQTQEYVPMQNSFKVAPFHSLQDSTQLSRHPELRLADMEIQAAKAATLVEKDGLLPKFNAGYKNVSFRGLGPDEVVYKGSDRFSSFQLGVAVPIFQKALKASIKSAQLEEEIQIQSYLTKKNELLSSLSQKALIYNELVEQLNDFKTLSLPNAEVIRTISAQKYASGDINYLDLVVLINQAVNIENEHLEMVKQINKLAIELKYLSGNN